MWLLGFFFLIAFTFAALLYTLATAFFPTKRNVWMARISLGSHWDTWRSEMENPYSLLNSRTACVLLAPLFLLLLIAELWLLV